MPDGRTKGNGATRGPVYVDTPEGLPAVMCSECELRLADPDSGLCDFCSFNDLAPDSGDDDGGTDE